MLERSVAEEFHLKDSLKVSTSLSKVKAMLWCFLMLSTLATTAANSCQAGGEAVTMSE